MKLVFTFLVMILLSGQTKGQGKYAGTKKAMIGKVYTGTKDLAALKGWVFVEGNLANSMDDPERIVCDVYKKGTSWLVFFSIMEDTASGKYKVMDLVEITGVSRGWSVRGGFCRQQEQESPYIVALGKDNAGLYMKTIRKAWKFNPDKRRFEAIPVRGIACENIGC